MQSEGLPKFLATEPNDMLMHHIMLIHTGAINKFVVNWTSRVIVGTYYVYYVDQ